MGSAWLWFCFSFKNSHIICGTSGAGGWGQAVNEESNLCVRAWFYSFSFGTC